VKKQKPKQPFSADEGNAALNSGLHNQVLEKDV
jgi:hypothetical protein